MRSSTLDAKDLEGRPVRRPDGLPGRLRLLIIAFQRWHQGLIDTWASALVLLRTDHPEMEVWGVPALSSGYRVCRRFIDGGMGAGIRDEGARRHTLAARTRLEDLSRALGIEDLSTIRPCLVDGGSEAL
jgi:hypothetical protein